MVKWKCFLWCVMLSKWRSFIFQYSTVLLAFSIVLPWKCDKSCLLLGNLVHDALNLSCNPPHGKGIGFYYFIEILNMKSTLFGSFKERYLAMTILHGLKWQNHVFFKFEGTLEFESMAYLLNVFCDHWILQRVSWIVWANCWDTLLTNMNLITFFFIGSSLIIENFLWKMFICYISRVGRAWTSLRLFWLENIILFRPFITFFSGHCWGSMWSLMLHY